MLFLFLSQFSHRNGPGNICSSLPVLSAGINKEETFWLYFCTVGFCRGVMTHSRIRSIGADGLKAQIQAVRIFQTEFSALHGRAVLCNLSGGHIFLQPVNKPAHSSGIFDMGFLQIFHFHSIFISFENSCRICLENKFRPLRDVLIKSIICAGVFHHNLLGRIQFFHIFIYLEIGVKDYACFLQLFPYFRRHCFFLNVKMYLIHGQDHIGKHYRIVFNIISPDIQQPHNIVQAGDHMDIRSGFFHFFSDLGDLFFPGLSGVLHIQDIHRFSGHFRTVCPDFPRKVNITFKYGLFVCKKLFILLSFGNADGPSIAAKTTFLGQIFLDKRIHCGNSFLPHFHQGNSGIFQLFRRLDEISSICPQAGLILCHHKGTC